MCQERERHHGRSPQCRFARPRGCAGLRADGAMDWPVWSAGHALHVHARRFPAQRDGAHVHTYEHFSCSAMDKAHLKPTVRCPRSPCPMVSRRVASNEGVQSRCWCSQRIIQGRKVTGAGLPVAIFGAREGHAAGFLSDQDMTREISRASRPPGRAPCLSQAVSVRRMATSVRTTRRRRPVMCDPCSRHFRDPSG